LDFDYNDGISFLPKWLIGMNSTNHFKMWSLKKRSHFSLTVEWDKPATPCLSAGGFN